MKAILRFCILIFICAGCGDIPSGKVSGQSQVSLDRDKRIAEPEVVRPQKGEVRRSDGLVSFNTGLTVSKVRIAKFGKKKAIIASSYEGVLFAMSSFRGTVLWSNALSGYMNRDVWCGDVTGDGVDEIFAANADGMLYCLDSEGNELWNFKVNDAPMNAVCTLKDKEGIPYVVCGGYDMNVYYLSSEGKLLKTLNSRTYSKEKSWGKGPKRVPPKFRHIANFLRPVKSGDGNELLALHAAINSNSARGSIYLFEPLADKPVQSLPVKSGGAVGEMRVGDIDGDGGEELLTGASSMRDDARLNVFRQADKSVTDFALASLRRQIDGFGYRVVQPEIMNINGENRYFILFGARIVLLPQGMDAKKAEVLACKYAFNDMWKDGSRIILASAQSGGSCIHILDTSVEGWKDSYVNLDPPGKISRILRNTAQARHQLKSFNRPQWEREPLPIYLMTESRMGVEDIIENISTNYSSPLFLKSKHLPRVEDWDRSGFGNEFYEKRRDRRKKYVLNQDEMVAELTPLFEEAPGIAYWGGHGNDPLMISLPAQKRIIDAAEGKKTVMIYPEMEQHDDNFAYVMKNHFYPLAEYARGKNANIFVRTKHAFWHSIVYMPFWSGLLSGEYADIFVPALEETTDKTMEQSVAARLGIWASGAVDQWGARCARDNTSYDRLRQHSHQELPNHFLRQMVYNISCGAQYINNFPVDQKYMSFLWELIAKGALYVPKRSELLSLSPVHIGMTEPDEHFLDIGNNVKWVTFFDEKEEIGNPMVFGRLNGTWPGAPNTEWDYSRYAAGVKERRLNYLPPFEHGIVMLAPPQNGIYADKDAPRGKLVDHLHPIYKGIMKEYISDGRDYISTDGAERFSADEYYRTVEDDIRKSSRKLPITVSGGLAWVVAQSSPTHLRLTLIDSGYINPGAKTATVHFHTVRPKKVRDVLAESEFFVCGDSTQIEIPCGLFRFIDVELNEPLY